MLPNNILSNLSSDFWYGILASLVAAFITWMIREIITELTNKSPLSGYWYTLVYGNEKVVKADFYYLKHDKKTGEITGKMERFYPSDQVGRKWEIRGMTQRQYLVLYSHSMELNTSMAAAVCRIVEDNCYEGYYLRYAETDYNIDLVEIKYYKTSISRRFYNQNKINALKAEIVSKIEKAAATP